MSRRRIIAPFRQFEGRSTTENHIRMTESMLHSKNWCELKTTSQKLYLYMRLWSRGRQEFPYSKKLGSNFVAPSTYCRAIKDLISHGFIEKSGYASNGGNHTPTTFRFSNKWHNDNYYLIYTSNNK